MGLAGFVLGEYFPDNGDVGWAWFEFENDELDKGDKGRLLRLSRCCGLDH